MQLLLPRRFHSTVGSNDQLFIDAVDMWRERSGGMQLPQLAINLVGIAMNKVLSDTPNQAGITRLTAASAPYTGHSCRHFHIPRLAHDLTMRRSKSPSQLNMEPQHALIALLTLAFVEQLFNPVFTNLAVSSLQDVYFDTMCSTT